MIRRLSILFLLIAVTVGHMMANPVTQAQAEQMARSFITQRPNASAKTVLRHMAVAKSGAKEIQPYYVFNAGDDEGFVIVSGEDRFANVIAYADRGRFTLDGAPASLRSWMELYARYVEAYWHNDSLAADTPARAGAKVVVAPLLDDIRWGQDAPFNDMCPTYSDGGKTVHYYTGCVATAATQIMRYYKYPTRGTGEKTCTVKGIELSANFGETTYDWDNMLAYYKRNGIFSIAQRDAVAKLAAHFGVAVEMEYEKAGSGASPMMVPGALKNYFGYDKHVTLRKRSYYGTTEWMNIIKAELDAGRPVYYGGASDAGQGGHAFVCDGYDDNGYVHINWGWYGDSNGYFLVNRLNPSDLGEGGGSGGYNRDQEMVTGIRPATESEGDVELPLYGSVRLSITPYGGNSFSLMTILENLDTDDFDGALAAVITQNGVIKKVLKEESLNVKGYAGSKSGTAYVTMRDITATADGLADGAYEIRFAYKAKGAKTWQVVRHYTGFPRYVDMTVEGGKVVLGEAHAVTPRVKLLAPITCNNEIHAGGAALFRVKLHNGGDDMQLKSVVVAMTSKANPEEVITGKILASVYEESDYNATVLVALPETATPGSYTVTAYAEGYEAYPFDDSAVGRTEVEVLDKTSEPILGVTQRMEWTTNDAAQTLKQGDMLMLGFVVRNFGAAGKAGVVTRLQDVNDPERSYVLRQTDYTFKQGEEKTFTLGRYLNIDAGTYTLAVTAVGENGKALTIAQPEVKTTVTIAPNSELAIKVKSMKLDNVLSPGKKSAGQLVVHLNKDYSNYVYLRLRQFTNTGGELVLMKRITNGKAGDDVTFNFNYTPTVAVGTYMPMVEYKSESASYVGADGLANYYREISVVDATGVDEITTEASAAGATISCREGVISVSTAEGVSVIRLSVASTAGATVWSGKVNQADLNSLPHGVYVVSVYTNRGTVTRKVCL